jgi:hypothetical protein
MWQDGIPEILCRGAGSAAAGARKEVWLYERALDVSGFHIHYIVPESLADDSVEFAGDKGAVQLGNDFDLSGFWQPRTANGRHRHSPSPIPWAMDEA